MFSLFAGRNAAGRNGRGTEIRKVIRPRTSPKCDAPLTVVGVRRPSGKRAESGWFDRRPPTE